jgi:hypothetical protein
LDVGLVVTVTPKSDVELRVRKDGQDVEVASNVQPVDIEARTDVELGIGDIATVYVRGGRREAQEKARNLEIRWSQEIEPHLAAAGVMDLAALDAKSAGARDLDSEIRAKDTELESLRTQVAGLDAAVEALPFLLIRSCNGLRRRSGRPAAIRPCVSRISPSRWKLAPARLMYICGLRSN